MKNDGRSKKKQPFNLKRWRSSNQYWYKDILDRVKALSRVEDTRVFIDAYDEILCKVETIDEGKATHLREKTFLLAELSYLYSKKSLKYDMFRNYDSKKLKECQTTKTV